MAYDTQLADKVRDYLSSQPGLKLEEKHMFSGVAFMVNGKMCINISHDKLMCRFDPALQNEVAERPGFEEMIMRGKSINGYCYVSPEGFSKKKDFVYWMEICLSFNSRAKVSVKRKKK